MSLWVPNRKCIKESTILEERNPFFRHNSYSFSTRNNPTNTFPHYTPPQQHPKVSMKSFTITTALLVLAGSAIARNCTPGLNYCGGTLLDIGKQTACQTAHGIIHST